MRNWGVFWGLIFILLGVLFLLDSLGLLPWNVWVVFWPVTLILLGFTLLLGGFGRRRSMTTENLALQLKGFEEAEVAIHYGAGRLLIGGGAAPDELLNGVFGGGVEHQLGEEGERALVNLRLPASSYWDWRGWPERTWDINLNADIPLDLILETGASESLVDLSNTQTKSIKLKTGASSNELLLPASAGRTKVEIEGGAGSITVQVPDGVAASIQGSVGAGAMTIDQAKFHRKGSVYRSLDYDQAANRVDIHVNFGAGEVRIS
jgi:hypothetical protein